MEYYSAIKRNTFESVLMRWMKLEPILQSEEARRRNTNTVYYHIYVYIYIYIYIYMEFRKVVMIILYARQ